MIDAFTTPASRLSADEREFLRDHLTWPESDFHRALKIGAQRGTICLALDHGEIVGWARTETWENWPTLEMFVRPEWRRRGVATFCAAGLAASNLFEHSGGHCAAFSREAVRVAETVGLSAILFQRDGKGGWKVVWE